MELKLNVSRGFKLETTYKIASQLRLTSNQREGLAEGLIEINKDLIGKGFIPMRGSQILHEIINKGIKNMKVDEQGKLDFK